jgi:hypothetical protein
MDKNGQMLGVPLRSLFGEEVMGKQRTRSAPFVVAR